MLVLVGLFLGDRLLIADTTGHLLYHLDGAEYAYPELSSRH